MPYEVRKQGDNYEIVNSDSGEVKATHEPPDAKEKAEAQLRLLEAVDNDPGWVPTHGG